MLQQYKELKQKIIQTTLKQQRSFVNIYSQFEEILQNILLFNGKQNYQKYNEQLLSSMILMIIAAKNVQKEDRDIVEQCIAEFIDILQLSTEQKDLFVSYLAIKCLNKYVKRIQFSKDQFTQISSLITSFMVAEPEFSYQLLKLGKIVYQYEKSVTTLNKSIKWIGSILGYSYFDQIMPVHEEKFTKLIAYLINDLQKLLYNKQLAFKNSQKYRDLQQNTLALQQHILKQLIIQLNVNMPKQLYDLAYQYSQNINMDQNTLSQLIQIIIDKCVTSIQTQTFINLFLAITTEQKSEELTEIAKTNSELVINLIKKAEQVDDKKIAIYIWNRFFDRENITPIMPRPHIEVEDI